MSSVLVNPLCTKQSNLFQLAFLYSNRPMGITERDADLSLSLCARIPLPRGQKLHERNADHLDLMSGVVKLTTPGGSQNCFVYNLRGVMEICRLSRQLHFRARGPTTCQKPFSLSMPVTLSLRGTHFCNNFVPRQLRRAGTV